jgi:hypothetical protein
MALTGLTIAADPSLLRDIRKEFTERRKRDADHVPRHMGSGLPPG